MIPTKEQQQLDQLNESLEALFQELEGYSHDALNRQPDPQTWSPLMVAKHLMMAEDYSVKYVKKKLSFNPTIPRKGLRTAMRSLFLELYLITPLKWKAPKAIGDEEVAGPHTLDQIRKQWLTHRQELEAMLQELPPERYQQEVYKHPFAGRLSVSGMLRFFQGHFDHHKKQIKARLT